MPAPLDEQNLHHPPRGRLGLESSVCGRYFLSLFICVFVQFYRGLNAPTFAWRQVISQLDIFFPGRVTFL